jgi:hypothetical protein
MALLLTLTTTFLNVRRVKTLLLKDFRIFKWEERA